MISCQGIGLDRYGRTLATCHLGDGTDIEQWMVRRGYAIAYRHFSNDYIDAEEAAKAERRGIWAGSFEEPWRWRREHPHPYSGYGYRLPATPYFYGYHP
jgi:endonuclease YncB( thermonuclease family)